MKLPNLLKATALRLTLRYVLAYALVMGIALGSLSLLTNFYVNSDIEATLREQLAFINNQAQIAGIEQAAQAVDRLVQQSDQEDIYYLLESEQGEKLSGNLQGWPQDSSIEPNGEVQNVWLEDNIVPVNIDDDEVYWPVVATQLKDGSRLLIAHSVQQIKDLHELTEFLLQTLSVSILLSLLLGITLSRAILKRIQRISNTADSIINGDLTQRVYISQRNDEFDALAHQLNTMLDCIQGLITGIREVTDNVAHDLRGPLTRLHNRLEITLLEERNPKEYRQVLEQAVQDTEYLLNTFNALLRIAQIESGNHREARTKFDLRKLVIDLAELYQPLAEEKSQTFNLLCEHPVEIIANTDLIAQMISNLLDNAIKYTPVNGRLLLAVRQSDTAVEITIQDSGPGIPEDERAHVMERFVRLDHSRNTPGNGLGLSLVQATCTLHHADLMLEDAEPGLIVKIRFTNSGFTACQ